MRSVRPAESSLRSFPALRGVLLLAVIGLTVRPGLAEASTLFVRVGGSDQADGSSPTTAFATIGKAARSLVNPGDTVVVGPGVYPEGNVSPIRGGSAGRPITFLADVGGALTDDTAGPVVLRPAETQSTGFLVAGLRYVRIEGFTIEEAADAGIQVRSSATGVHSGNIEIVGCRTNGSEKRGIDVLAEGPVLLDGNTTVFNGSGGISVVGVGGGGGPFTLKDNLSDDNAAPGILVDRAVGGTIRGNRSSGNALDGILVRRSYAVAVTGNAVRNNRDGGIRIDVDAGNSGISEDFVVTDNTVEGSSKAGLAILGGGAVVVERNLVSASGGVGILLESGAIALEPTVRDNTILNSTSDGMLATAIVGGEISDNRFDSNHGGGLKLRRATGTLVSNNTASGNREAGIELGAPGDLTSAGRDVTIRANTVSDNLGSGINVIGNSQVLVVENVSRRNLGAGLAVAAGSESLVTIEGNRAEGSTAEGILVDGAATAVVRDNTASGSGDLGIRITGILDGTITGNSVDDSGKAGLAVAAAGQLEVRNNQLRRNAGAGLQVQGVGDALRASISSNRLEGGGSHGLVVSRVFGGSVSQNQISRPGASGMLVEESANLVLVGNSVANAAANGFDVRSSEALTVASNTVSSSAGNGLALEIEGPVTISGNTIRKAGGAGIDVSASASGTGSGAVQPLIRDNVLAENGSGVFVQAASGGLLLENQIEDSVSDGILVQRSANFDVAKNQVRRSGRNGIAIGNSLELAGRDLVVRENEVTDSRDGGIVVSARGDVAVRANRVTRSASSGVSVRADGRSRLIATDNISGDNGALGLFVRGPVGGRAQSNVLFSNGDSGVQLRDTMHIALVNNLIYANAFDGVALGTAGLGTSDTLVAGNTIFANGSRGVNVGADSPATTMINNILQDNEIDPISVVGASAQGVVSGFNLTPDLPTDGLRIGPYDVVAPAAFVDADGPDDVLGGTGYVDDDFRLQQIRAGQANDSPGVDAGSASATVIGVGGSTATGGLADVGRIDVGYHYEASGDAVVSLPAPFMPVYVRANGNAANDGLSAESALPSIREAGLRAANGMTVVVGPGRYTDVEPIRVRPRAGQITFQADRTGRVTGDPSGDVIVDATGRENGFVIVGAEDVTIAGFHVTNSTVAGIQIRSGAHGARIRDNVVYSNERRGIEVREADAAEIVNNLVYANGTGGVQIQQSTGSVAASNTIYGNGEDGLLVGGSPTEIGMLAASVMTGAGTLRITGDEELSLTIGEMLLLGSDPTVYSVTSAVAGETFWTVAVTPPVGRSHPAEEKVVSEKLRAPEATVIRNVVAMNQNGVVVKANSQDGYLCGANVVPDGFAGNTPRCESDVIADPALVDPDGADDVLGGLGYADDDFHLLPSSVAVDLDPCLPSEVPAGTTRTDGAPDLCPVDSGYHYPVQSF